MKRPIRLTLMVLLLFVLALPSLSAQSAIDTLASDLSDFLLETGRTLTPQMQSAAITSLEAGSAEIGGFPGMYFSLGVGALFTDGLADVIDGDYTIDVEGILEDQVEGNDVYDLIRGFLPLPVLRVTYGVGLFEDLEASVQLMTIPSALTDTAGVSGVSAGLTNIGGRVRKVVVSDGPGVPAVSLGVGYVFSSFNLGYELEELENVDVGETQITVTGGEVSYELVTNSAGIDVRVSERVGPIVPYLAVSSWYQWSSFDGGIEALAGTVSNTEVGPVDQLRSFDDNDLNVLLSGGVDLRLGVFVFFLEGSYAFSTQAPAAYTGFRLQF
ncbi:MAG: hypothetical protein ACOC47_05535 [Alkalispirochaetaceae bacterium]